MDLFVQHKALTAYTGRQFTPPNKLCGFWFCECPYTVHVHVYIHVHTVIYGTNFWQQAAAESNRDWSRVDLSLYARFFTGWGKAVSWCKMCVTLDHDTGD